MKSSEIRWLHDLIDIHLSLVLGATFDLCGFALLFVVDLLRFAYPLLYLYSTAGATFSAINFAGWSAWVTYAFGEESLVALINNIALFLRADHYFKTALANALTLLSAVGNDYLASKWNTSMEMFMFI